MTRFDTKDKAGRWSLSPGFNLTYSYNPAGKWTATHQMTINGKDNHFTEADFKACARVAFLKRGRARTIAEEVRQAVSRWRVYADDVGVDAAQRDQIQRALRI